MPYKQTGRDGCVPLLPVYMGVLDITLRGEFALKQTDKFIFIYWRKINKILHAALVFMFNLQPHKG